MGFLRALGRAIGAVGAFLMAAVAGSPEDAHNRARGEVPDMRGGRRGV